MSELSKLPNIGHELEEILFLIGIKTVDDLLKTGSKQAYIRIKSIDPQACINKLFALEGACQNIRWHLLDKQKKRELKDLFEALQQKKVSKANSCQENS